MYSKLFKTILFPIMELYKGTCIMRFIKFLDKTQWWKLDQLESLQNKLLRSLIRHAYENVPYYYRVMKK